MIVSESIAIAGVIIFFAVVIGAPVVWKLITKRKVKWMHIAPSVIIAVCGSLYGKLTGAKIIEILPNGEIIEKVGVGNFSLTSATGQQVSSGSGNRTNYLIINSTESNMVFEPIRYGSFGDIDYLGTKSVNIPKHEWSWVAAEPYYYPDEVPDKSVYTNKGGETYFWLRYEDGNLLTY